MVCRRWLPWLRRYRGGTTELTGRAKRAETIWSGGAGSATKVTESDCPPVGGLFSGMRDVMVSAAVDAQNVHETAACGVFLTIDRPNDS
jgi:hypothetical protein